MKTLLVLVVVLAVALTTQIKISAIVLSKADCSNVRAQEKSKCTPIIRHVGARMTVQTAAYVTVSY